MTARIIPLHRGKPFTVIEQPIPDYPQRFVSDNIGRVVPDEEWANALPRTALRPSGLQSTFAACVDALADFVATCVEYPGHAYALILIGQSSVVLAALVWALA